MKIALIFSLLIVILSSLVSPINDNLDIKASVTINTAQLKFSPEKLSITTTPLSHVEKSMSFSRESGEEDIDISFFLQKDKIKDWISFSGTNFNLEPGNTKNIIAYIDVPDIAAGTYSGNIHALANNQDLIIPVDITVTDDYGIDAKIEASPDRLRAGKNIHVSTELEKSSNKAEGSIQVLLEYNVFRQKNLITSFSTTMDVEHSNEKTISIPIPAHALGGRYTIGLTATHLDKVSKDKDNFSVRPNWFGRLIRIFGWFR